VRLAIAQLPNLESRLHLLMWHLADRWGRRELDGVVLPLRLSQGLLAELVAATRSSVNTALRRLTADGVLRQRDDRTWLLIVEPPPALVAGMPAAHAAFRHD